MSKHKDTLNWHFDDVRQADYNPQAECRLEVCHRKALEIVTELENALSTSWKASNAQWKMISKAQDEVSELRTKLESKNKALGLVVQALAETIGEQERGEP